MQATMGQRRSGGGLWSSCFVRFSSSIRVVFLCPVFCSSLINFFLIRFLSGRVHIHFFLRGACFGCFATIVGQLPATISFTCFFFFCGASPGVDELPNVFNVFLCVQFCISAAHSDAGWCSIFEAKHVAMLAVPKKPPALFTAFLSFFMSQVLSPGWPCFLLPPFCRA